MNYYKRHLGDYAKDTGHLSALEHGVYTLLLDRYYSTEKPIPEADAFKIARASSAAERKATCSVLGEFFKLRDGQWHHSYADRLIQDALESEGEADARREHERERQHRHRERRKELFAELRKHGEVPSFDTPTGDLETLLSRVTGRNAERDKNGPVTPPATAIPLATSHKPEKERETGLADDWQPPEETARYRLTVAGVEPTWTQTDLATFVAHYRGAGTVKTQAQWLELFVKWMLRKPAFAGSRKAPQSIESQRNVIEEAERLAFGSQ